MPDGVLDQRLEDEGRYPHRQHLRCHAQADRQAVTEARALKLQVRVHEPQLFGERSVLAVLAECPANELREADEQVPGPFRIGADEGFDRGQRVVDEMRADLGAEEVELRLHRAGARGVKLGERQVRGHEPGDLRGGSHQPRVRGRS
jgi:hypothetical protein